MKLVAIEESQLVALLHVAQPDGPLPMRTLIDGIREKFQFSGVPKTIEEVSKDGFNFAHGSFDGTAIDSLSIHDDGIVILSRSSTEFLDRVFGHITKWGQDEYGIQLIKTHELDKFYRSGLVIETDKDILGVLRVLDKVRTSFEKALVTDSGIKASYEPFGIAFASDSQKSIVKPSAFRIERRLGMDFKYNRYLCEAPLKTESHLRILSELEASC